MNKTTEIEKIEFSRDEIPVRKKINIEGIHYNIEIQYNGIGDFYTSVLSDENYIPIVSTKLVYGENVFFGGIKGSPLKELKPLNITNLSRECPEELRVNQDNFEKNIQLYLI